MIHKHAKLTAVLKAKLREVGLLKKVQSGTMEFKSTGKTSPLFAVPEPLKSVRGLTPRELTQIRKQNFGRAAARKPDKGFSEALNELREKGAISEIEAFRLMNEHPHWSNIAKGMLAKGTPTKSLGLKGKEVTGSGAYGELVGRNILSVFDKILKSPMAKNLRGKNISLNVHAAGEPHLRLVK